MSSPARFPSDVKLDAMLVRADRLVATRQQELEALEVARGQPSIDSLARAYEAYAADTWPKMDAAERKAFVAGFREDLVANNGSRLIRVSSSR